jgi:peptidoglycan/LPS O-acetylase OafA/YrhL
MEANGITQYAGVAMFGFLAVGAVALFSFLSVLSWLGLRSAERQSRDRFTMMKAILENPGDHADRMLAVWREQELRKEQQDRRARLMGGAVTVAVGAALALMMVFLGDSQSHVWAVGLIPIFVGVVIALFALFERRSAN